MHLCVVACAVCCPPARPHARLNLASSPTCKRLCTTPLLHKLATTLSEPRAHNRAKGPCRCSVWFLRPGTSSSFCPMFFTPIKILFFSLFSSLHFHSLACLVFAGPRPAKICQYSQNCSAYSLQFLQIQWPAIDASGRFPLEGQGGVMHVRLVNRTQKV